MHLLDYAFYIYWRQFEMLVQLGLALKLLDLHPVTISHLSLGIRRVVYQLAR
jgi:hypothetical protein